MLIAKRGMVAIQRYLRSKFKTKNDMNMGPNAEPIVPAIEKKATDCPLCSPAMAAPSG